MKKIIFLLLAFLCVSSLFTSKVEAQDTYQSLTKDACGRINIAPYTYSGNDVVTLGKINPPQEGKMDVRITRVNTTGGGGSTSFSLDKTFDVTTISGGGANFIVPGLGNFFKSQTQNATSTTNFDIKTTQEVTFYPEGYDVLKPDKGIIPRKENCESTLAAAITVPQQAKTQQQNQANPNPQQGQPAQQANPVNLIPAVLCTSSAGVQGVDTAIGCIPVEGTQHTVAWLLTWVVGIAGGIAFLLILWSAIQIMTAQGDPQKLNAGREVLTAAISGLIFVIFSVFLLRLIGINILNLGVFGF